MKKFLTTAAVCTAMTLSSGCAIDAYTGEKKVSNTAKGAGIGALGGALIAYLDNKDASSDKRKERILEAAGGGALIGGGIGAYMDVQNKKLREKLQGTGVQIQKDGDNITLIMPGNVTFASGSSNVNASFYPVLDSVATVVNEYDKTLIGIAGHTDSTGSDATNQALSEKRAKSVSGYLVSKDVLADRIVTVGFGEQHPVADNSTEAGREQNRRVEITLQPITK